MRHSPYRKTITYVQPINDLNSFKQGFIKQRIRYNDDEDCNVEELLDDGELLLEQCEFLEEKLSFKKSQYGKLYQEKSELKQENEALEKKNKNLEEEFEAEKLKITELQSELERARTKIGTEEQPGSNGDRREEPNTQDAKLEIGESENLQEEQSSVGTAGMTNSQKRGVEINLLMEEKAVKKGKTQG